MWLFTLHYYEEGFNINATYSNSFQYLSLLITLWPVTWIFSPHFNPNSSSVVIKPTSTSTYLPLKQQDNEIKTAVSKLAHVLASYALTNPSSKQIISLASYPMIGNSKRKGWVKRPAKHNVLPRWYTCVASKRGLLTLLI